MVDSVKSAGASARPSPQTAARQLAQKPGPAAAAKPPTPQQIQQLKEQQLKQARAKLSPASFASSSQEILRKFSKYPPSLTFHIYDTHYRFNNTEDSSIIPRESAMARSFLQHVIREEIPVEMTELLKDFSIRFYDGCLVLQVFDHRDMVAAPGAGGSSVSSASSGNGSPGTGKGTGTGTGTGISGSGGRNSGSGKKGTGLDPARAIGPKDTGAGSQTPQTPAGRPKSYRTLLRPTPQSLYYDLLYHTDSTLTKFTDLLSLQMEAEILTLTHRKLDLAVPLNPYLQDAYLHPEIESPRTEWDEARQDVRVVHAHREPTQTELRKLHQDQMTMQKSSEFEEMMFLLSGKHKNPSESTAEKKLVVVGPSKSSQGSDSSLETTPSAGAAIGSGMASDKTGRGSAATPITSQTSVLGNGNGTATSNQFMRLRFIEEIRKKKESQKVQAGAAVAAHTQSSIAGNPMAAPANGAVNGMFAGASAGPAVTQTPMAGKGPMGGSRAQPGPGPGPNVGPNVGPNAGQAQQNQFQQNQQFHKQQQQQQNVGQRQNAMYQHNSKAPRQQQPPQQHQQQQQQQGFGQMAQQFPNGQNAQMAARMAPEFAATRGPQNGSQNVSRQNLVMQNQKLGQAPGQQMAKQADRLRAQQLQAQQARQQQQQQQQQMRQMSPQQNVQQQPQNYSQLKQSQQAQMSQMAQVQAAKRQKLGTTPQMAQQTQFPAQMRTPNMGAGPQPGSGVNTPIMGNASNPSNGLANSSPQMPNQMPPGPQSAQGQGQGQAFQAHQNTMGNRPSTQPALGGPAPDQKTTLQQQQNQQRRQQHQQIFQMTLTPQDQHTFRQLQSRMNALLQMGNTGVAPNRTQLTAQQQQQAMQQAKHIQQQLLQRFPTYFQRLKQYQTLQEQRSMAGQRQGQAQGNGSSSQQSVGNSMGIDGQAYPQQNAGVNMGSPAMQQQMMSSPMMPQMNNGMQSRQGKQ